MVNIVTLSRENPLGNVDSFAQANIRAGTREGGREREKKWLVASNCRSDDAVTNDRETTSCQYPRRDGRPSTRCGRARILNTRMKTVVAPLSASGDPVFTVP